MWKHLNNIFISLGKIPRSAIVLLHGRYIFIILRNCPKVLWSSYSTFTFGKVIYEIFSCFTCIPALCTVNLIYFSYFNGCIVITWYNLYVPYDLILSIFSWEVNYFLLWSLQIFMPIIMGLFVVITELWIFYYSSYHIFIQITLCFGHYGELFSKYMLLCIYLSSHLWSFLFFFFKVSFKELNVLFFMRSNF